MTGVFYLLRSPEAKERLVDEVRAVWPVLDEAPSYEELEKLPFLASLFICETGVCSKNGTDCCDQRGVTHRYPDTRWPSTGGAASWRGDIRR
jgi:hypothetical protein